jgi:orotidine-5'-phosphate decarboxylase
MFAHSPAARVFVALDTAEESLAVRLAGQLSGTVGGLKLGKEFFTAHGPQGVRRVAETCDTSSPTHPPHLFLDLKFHDIPNTVAGAVHAATRLAPGLLTLHAAGGRAMMRAAAAAATEAAEVHGVARPRLLGVTVLTSLDDADLESVGQATPVSDQVRRLAALAADSGLDGVVCSPRELDLVRRELDRAFLTVVPGIRPDWAQSDDQKRVMTPGEALACGADALVIGRPITGADDPVAAARRIVQEVAVNKIAWG